MSATSYTNAVAAEDAQGPGSGLEGGSKSVGLQQPASNDSMSRLASDFASRLTLDGSNGNDGPPGNDNLKANGSAGPAPQQQAGTIQTMEASDSRALAGSSRC